MWRRLTIDEVPRRCADIHKSLKIVHKPLALPRPSHVAYRPSTSKCPKRTASPLTYRDYKVGWICALPVEMAAAQAMLDERHDPLLQRSHDHNTYTLGRIGVHNVVLACLPSGVTGTTSAASVVTRMLSSFEWLKFGLMVGIGGGVPSQGNDIRLGDVVVSNPTATSGGVIQYDCGKTVQDGRFTRTGLLNKPPDVLLTALTNLRAKHLMENHQLSERLSEMVMKYPNMRSDFTYQGAENDLLFEADYDHQGGNATCSQCDASRLVKRDRRSLEYPVIHYGLIASGNQVMRHGATRNILGKELGVLCFEMEAAGLVDHFPCLIIRGICDYADSHKNKHWQSYAAAVAAAYAKELLCVVPQNEVINIHTAVEVTSETGESLSQVFAASTILKGVSNPVSSITGSRKHLEQKSRIAKENS